MSHQRGIHAPKIAYPTLHERARAAPLQVQHPLHSVASGSKKFTARGPSRSDLTNLRKSGSRLHFPAAPSVDEEPRAAKQQKRSGSKASVCGQGSRADCPALLAYSSWKECGFSSSPTAACPCGRRRRCADPRGASQSGPRRPQIPWKSCSTRHWTTRLPTAGLRR